MYRQIPDQSISLVPKLSEKELPALPCHARLLSSFKCGSQRLVKHWWAWEILAAALSIAATIGLVVILAKSDGVSLESLSFGAAHLSLNTIVAAVSTVIRAALAVTVAGALNQSPWNWFAQPQSGKPLQDLDIFGDAASDSWSSLRLLARTKGRYASASSISGIS